MWGGYSSQTLLSSSCMEGFSQLLSSELAFLWICQTYVSVSLSPKRCTQSCSSDLRKSSLTVLKVRGKDSHCSSWLRDLHNKNLPQTKAPCQSTPSDFTFHHVISEWARGAKDRKLTTSYHLLWSPAKGHQLFILEFGISWPLLLKVLA